MLTRQPVEDRAGVGVSRRARRRRPGDDRVRAVQRGGAHRLRRLAVAGQPAGGAEAAVRARHRRPHAPLGGDRGQLTARGQPDQACGASAGQATENGLGAGQPAALPAPGGHGAAAVKARRAAAGEQFQAARAKAQVQHLPGAGDEPGRGQRTGGAARHQLRLGAARCIEIGDREGDRGGSARRHGEPRGQPVHRPGRRKRERAAPGGLRDRRCAEQGAGDEEGAKDGRPEAAAHRSSEIVAWGRLPEPRISSISGRLLYAVLEILNSSRPPWVGPTLAVEPGLGSICSGARLWEVHA